VAAHGSGRGRTYTLCAKIYRKQGQKAYSIRQAGFDQIQQEQMVTTGNTQGRLLRASALTLRTSA
jgi:ATP-dependent DNA helicase RecG